MIPLRIVHDAKSTDRPNYAAPGTLRNLEVLEVRERWGRLLDESAFAAHYGLNAQQARTLLNYCFDPTACWHELEQ